MAKGPRKSKLQRLPLVRWLKEKEPRSQAEILEYFQENKGRLEKILGEIYKSAFFYRVTNRLFSLFSKVAGLVDTVRIAMMEIILKIPAPLLLKNALKSASAVFNFKGTIEFFRAKTYSLSKSPHNANVVQLMDDILSKASKQGVDVKKHFPAIFQKFKARKNQLLQHSYFGEYSKSLLERILAIPFSFNRSITPVLADTSFWHRFYSFLESRIRQDLILVDDDAKQISVNTCTEHEVASSAVVRTLYETSALKAAGHRVFIIGHHEGYLGPYFVRSVLRSLGFDNLVKNCNTVAGPRVFSNIILKSGASNVGNLFLTLPSQKTTKLKEQGLAFELQKNARRTQFLIKMPNSGLKVIESLSYEAFMDNVVNLNKERLHSVANHLSANEFEELFAYLHDTDVKKTLAELDPEDYKLFKEVMYEPFLIFPEGSRSYTEKNGDVVLKYVNPRYMQAYLRPGDVILAVNLVGGSDLVNGWHLRGGRLGLSMANPYEVSAEMIANYAEEGLNVMRTIANLKNIKKVTFDEKVQAGEKSHLTAK